MVFILYITVEIQHIVRHHSFHHAQGAYCYFLRTDSHLQDIYCIVNSLPVQYKMVNMHHNLEFALFCEIALLLLHIELILNSGHETLSSEPGLYILQLYFQQPDVMSSHDI